jgi:hypothetical protein
MRIPAHHGITETLQLDRVWQHEWQVAQRL